MKRWAVAAALGMAILAATGPIETTLRASPRSSLAGLHGSLVRFSLILSPEDACMDRAWLWPDGTRSTRGFDCEAGESDSDSASRRFGAGEWTVCVVLTDSQRLKRVCASFRVVE